MKKRGPCFTVVDDDSHVLFFVERALAEAFPESVIKTFTDGEDALHHVVKAGTDMLITDHSMTHMNGADLIRELRSRGSNIPMIMISSSPHALEEATTAGATRFMDKGEAMKQLVEAVRELLGSSAPHARVGRSSR